MATYHAFRDFEDPFKMKRVAYLNGEPSRREEKVATELYRKAENATDETKTLKKLTDAVDNALSDRRFRSINTEDLSATREWDQLFQAVGALEALKSSGSLSPEEFNQRLEELINTSFADYDLSEEEKRKALDLRREAVHEELERREVVTEKARQQVDERLDLAEVANWNGDFLPQILSKADGSLLSRKDLLQNPESLRGQSFDASFGKGKVSPEAVSKLVKEKGLRNVFSGLSTNDYDVTITRVRGGKKEEAHRESDGNFYFDTEKYGHTRMGIRPGDKVEIVSVEKREGAVEAKTDAQKQKEALAELRQKEADKVAEKRTEREAQKDSSEQAAYRVTLKQAVDKFGHEGAAALPAGLRFRTRKFWERNLSTLGNGPKLMETADHLKVAAGVSKSGVELFLDALDRGLSDNCVRAKDILREAGYNNLKSFMARYKELNALATKTDDQALEQKKMEDILVQGYRLMQDVEALSLNESVTEEASEELTVSEEAKTVVNILDSVFPVDAGDKTRTALIFKRDASYYTETLIASRRRAKQGLNQTSGDSMYEQMLAEYTNPNLDTGMIEGDLDRLLSKLEALRILGVSQLVLPSNKEVQRKLGLKKTIEDNPGLTAQDLNLAEITVENAANLPELDQVLIRLGRDFYNGVSREREQGKVREKEDPVEIIAREPEEIQTVAMGIYNDALERGVELTGEQVKEIVRNIQAAHTEICDAGSVGVLRQEKTTYVEDPNMPRATKELRLSGAYNKTFTLLKGKDGQPVITLDGGFSIDSQGNISLKRIVNTVPNFHAALGVKQEWGRDNRNSVRVKVGALAGPGNLALAGSVDYSRKIGNAEVWSVDASAGAMLPLKGVLPPALLLRLGVSRDIEARAKQLSEKILANEINPILEAQLANFDAFQYAHPETRDAMRTMYYMECRRAAQEAGTERLFPLQLTAAGVALVITPSGSIPVPYLQIAFKTGSRWVRAVPDQFRDDAVVQAKLDELDRSHGGKMREVYVAGDLEFGAKSGKLTIQESEFAMDTHDILNGGFKKDGLSLEPDANGLQLKIAQDLGSSRISVKLDNVAGADGQHSQIQAYLEGGRVYLNLDPNEQSNLRIHVVEKDYPDQKDGFTHHVEVYVMADPSSSLRTMQGADEIVIERPYGGAGKIMVNERAGRGETATIFRSLDAMRVAGIEKGSYVEDLAERDAADQELSGTLEQEWHKSEMVLDRATQDKIYAIAENYNGKLDYKKLTSDRAYTQEVIAKVQKENPNPGFEWNNAAVTQFIQAAEEVSRAKAPDSPEALANYIEGWNRRAITNLCIENGMDGSHAEIVAKAVAGYYKEQVLLKLEKGEELPITKVKDGRLVHIRTGKGGKEFLSFLHTRQSREVELVGELDLNRFNLVSKIGLSPELADEFIQATRKDLSQLEQFDEANAESILRSRYGLALSDYSSVLFGAKTARLLNRLYKNPSKFNSLDDGDLALWKEYTDAVKAIKETGYARIGNKEVSTSETMSMAFAKQCRNFTTTLDCGLSISAPESELQKISITEEATATKKSKFIKLGLALGKKKSEKHKTTETEDEPEPEEEGPTHTGSGEQHTGEVANGETETGNESTASEGKAEI